MQHYIDYLQDALVSDVDLHVMDRDGQDHKLIYVPHTGVPQTWVEGFYIDLQGIQTNIQFDYNPGIPRENPYILTPRSVNLLCGYAMKRTVLREAHILAPAIEALTLEFGTALQFMVAKDYRLIEKDRGAILVQCGPCTQAVNSEKRFTGYMADSSCEGWRVDKHSVSGWRMRYLHPGEPLMQLLDATFKNHLA